MHKISITIKNTYFVLRLHDTRLQYIVNQLIERLTTHSLDYNPHTKRYTKKKDKDYYSFIPRFNEYRFPILILKDTMLWLGNHNLQREDIAIRRSRNTNIALINLHMKSEYQLRDYQEKYCEALTGKKSKTFMLIDLLTGKGKSLIASYALVKLNRRTVIIVKPAYVKKWVDDLIKYTDVSEEDIYCVAGSESLADLMTEDNISYKFIIMSLRTVSNYITSYENDTLSLPVKPQNLMRHLSVSILFNDESHQEYHALYKTLLYFDVDRVIGSSATFDTKQTEVKNMYNLVFPPDNMISNIIDHQPYINVNAISYRLQMNGRIKYKGPKGYNHNLFEQSILKNNILMRGYFEMIMHYARIGYITRRVKGDKLLIFAASISMCTILTNMLARKYPELDVRRYVEDDPYSNILEADISISTVLSAGTALDIPGLITVLQTVSISSLQANLQSLGRLREIPGKEVKFYYFYTTDIDKQYNMHKERKELFYKFAKEYNHEQYYNYVKSR